MCLFFLRMFWKNGLAFARMTLCISTCLPSSLTRVTSVKSLSSRRLPNVFTAFSLKSFHCRQSFSDILSVKDKVIILTMLADQTQLMISWWFTWHIINIESESVWLLLTLLLDSVWQILILILILTFILTLLLLLEVPGGHLGKVFVYANPLTSWPPCT